jgi:hypothetical protein
MEANTYPLQVGYSDIGPFFILRYSSKEIYIWEPIDSGDGKVDALWMRWPNDWELLPTQETNLLTFLTITGQTLESTMHLLNRKQNETPNKNNQ